MHDYRLHCRAPGQTMLHDCFLQFRVLGPNNALAGPRLPPALLCTWPNRIARLPPTLSCTWPNRAMGCSHPPTSSKYKYSSSVTKCQVKTIMLVCVHGQHMPMRSSLQHLPRKSVRPVWKQVRLVLAKANRRRIFERRPGRIRRGSTRWVTL
jgi:hypothetical protein